MNKTSSIEWLTIALHDLKSAQILYDANHYIATEYLKEDRYPNPHYSLPPKEEVQEVLMFTEELFDKVCKMLKIEKSEITNA